MRGQRWEDNAGADDKKSHSSSFKIVEGSSMGSVELVPWSWF